MGRNKILVMGSAGMAGHVMTSYLEEIGAYDVFNLAHKKKLNEKSILLDVTDFAVLEQFLDKTGFDVIINCIGLLNQYAAACIDRAILINSYLPHFLESKYRNTQTKIIHLSTDCVFSGKTGSYTEKSFKDGDTYYDRTKALGEIGEGRNLTFRTSIIGPDINYDGIGLFNWFMKAKGEINGYVNAIWTGVTTIELAKAVEKAVLKDISGLYHLVSDKSINKYELLSLFKNIFNKKDVHINKYNNELLDKSLINTRRDFDYKVLGYNAMISEMREWILKHSSFYPHYTS
ncbi:dTDP-4-dehydrorhamnose reductase [Ruminiclostridium sufflavum DSM 19573]|uniref:dTDP-4-dehydrorhamnose reductase n=1 Tax=Ruminiclostridium sufflavum DSM 19573 TaxID=1121337 RepID=A0A318XH71_9FIRM|nr:SDR family oxidoreductase [Ruminiclostridium sufflavum]PYG85779.1 dTDP-4-dehydrorhamnose reductase [Ruminiclostridium sufflavum DSM 19573]